MNSKSENEIDNLPYRNVGQRHLRDEEIFSGLMLAKLANVNKRKREDIREVPMAPLSILVAIASFCAKIGLALVFISMPLFLPLQTVPMIVSRETDKDNQSQDFIVTHDQIKSIIASMPVPSLSHLKNPDSTPPVKTGSPKVVGSSTIASSAQTNSPPTVSLIPPPSIKTNPLPLLPSPPTGLRIIRR